ncbi:M14 family zinc carboxypeptidase [Mangrovicoccus ximenensis]|uniref:M14 family zinc carboxypeptidase n=1 Tax=Mangrovicoccus ximenensis TaxID=1911570 RepID=UPI000D359833|nr:succinylglutamate desuccinylase/aspartoacylase family protein [Mangrovicoccus ximenensis]
MTDPTDERSPSPDPAPGPSPTARDLLGFGPENARTLTVLRFGTPGARPKVYLQAGLHADELPGMLVLSRLAALLGEAAAKGLIRGEIVLVPVANPIGLSQIHGGYLRGRHDDATGENYNRGYPDLAEMVSGTIGDALGADAAANVAAIRAAMKQAIAGLPVRSELDGLRIRLMELAHDADIVLDLHADNEALVHLYTGNALWPAAADLAAEIDARAVLLCDLSGGHPFDEACSGPWWALAAAFPGHPCRGAPGPWPRSRSERAAVRGPLHHAGQRGRAGKGAGAFCETAGCLRARVSPWGSSGTPPPKSPQQPAMQAIRRAHLSRPSPAMSGLCRAQWSGSAEEATARTGCRPLSARSRWAVGRRQRQRATVLAPALTAKDAWTALAARVAAWR